MQNREGEVEVGLWGGGSIQPSGSLIHYWHQQITYPTIGLLCWGVGSGQGDWGVGGKVAETALFRKWCFYYLLRKLIHALLLC